VALVPGSNAGPYRIVEPLGRGGMASVYRAYEPKLDRYVALKVLPREFLHDPNFAQRFRQEAQVIAKLEHPNIIPIYAYDIDEAEGIPWMAMRLVAAGSLAQLIKRQRLPLARAVAVLRGVADALDYAHGKGIVHRDVKPQNVLLDDAGRVYLADFGIAKILESSGGLTASGMITGTPQYMAPEQATGLKVGPRADVYALGIVAYELFTGRVPFSADTPVAVLMKHVQEPLPLPGPEVVPEPMLRALLKAATKKPEDRWPSAGSFVDALASGLGAPAAVSAAPTVAIPREAPLAPPTIVSPQAAPLSPGTAPPLPPRPPVMRPPAVPSDVVVIPPRKGLSSAVLLALGALGLVGFVAVTLAAWLLLGRSSGSPPAGPAPSVAQASATVAPPATRPAGSRDPAPLPTRSPLAPAVVPTRPGLTPPTPRALPAPTPTPAPVPAASPTPTPPVAPPPATPVPAPPAVDPEVERLAAALSDRDAATRRRAAQDLSARGPLAAPAVPALVTALADRSPDVRLRAAEALGRIGPAAQAASTPLAEALRDTDPLVPAEAAKALGLLGEAAAPAAGALGSALGHKDVAVRREAARALARMGRHAEPALAALVAALSDKDKTVCSQAARALGRIGAAARPALPRLTALSRDPDVLVSREAQVALESIGRPQP
jgi:serine/threonine-protein kinase